MRTVGSWVSGYFGMHSVEMIFLNFDLLYFLASSTRHASRSRHSGMLQDRPEHSARPSSNGIVVGNHAEEEEEEEGVHGMGNGGEGGGGGPQSPVLEEVQHHPDVLPGICDLPDIVRARYLLHCSKQRRLCLLAHLLEALLPAIIDMRCRDEQQQQQLSASLYGRPMSSDARAAALPPAPACGIMRNPRAEISRPMLTHLYSSSTGSSSNSSSRSESSSSSFPSIHSLSLASSSSGLYFSGFHFSGGGA